MRRRELARLASIVTAIAIAAAVLLPAAASAGIVASTTLDFPSNLKVGDQNIPATITLTNADTAPDASADNTVCNPGLATVPAPCATDTGIILTPACTVVTGNTCSSADSGAFGLASDVGDILMINRRALAPAVDPPAIPACDGPDTFTVREIGDTGSYRFQPFLQNEFELPHTQPSCTLTFYVTVKQLPADADPSLPGVQTHQIVTERQYSGATASAQSVASATDTVGANDRITITGKSSAGVPLGNLIYDTADIEHLADGAGGSVTFRLYPPGDPTCAGTPEATDTDPVHPANTSVDVMSNVIAPKEVGTYHWTAAYDGDANNVATSPTDCGSATQSVKISPRVVVPEEGQPGGPAPGRTGRRAKALRKCKKGKIKQRVKKCRRKAAKLPV